MTILSAAMASAGEVKLLRGDVWQGMTQDEKVSFLGGAGQVVLVENELMAQIPAHRDFQSSGWLQWR